MSEYEDSDRDFEPGKFSCRICWGVFKNPVTIPCGHSFCSECVQSHWNGEDGQPRYTCPQCGQSFSPRPVLVRNVQMAKLMDQLKKNSEGKCFAGLGDIPCDLCYRKKQKAVKSCLGCWLSYCDSHLSAHKQSSQLKKHKLVAPRDNLGDSICSIHHKPITEYCTTDFQLVCPLCAASKHKGHKLIPAAAEMEERKLIMLFQMDQLEKRLKYHEEELESLAATGRVLMWLNAAADTEVDNSEERYKELICLMEKRRSDVEQEIRAQQQTTERQVQQLQENLEQEISQMKRLQTELDSLSQTQDPGQFLLKYKHLSLLKEEPQSSSTPLLHCFEDITEALSDLPDKLQTCPNMGLALTQNNLLMRQPTTREEFLKYAVNITMDPNTVHKRLVLTEENRKITTVKEEQDYPDHPERFTHRWQVLSSQALTGRCYFEVEWENKLSFLGFTYKSIQRKEDVKESALGYNNVSWALRTGLSNHISHNGEEMQVRKVTYLKKGVFLDHSAGVISFYGIDHKDMYHFGTVQTTFSEPLYIAAGFTFCEMSVEFLKLK